MSLYNKYALKNYSHYCFFTTMLNGNEKAKLLYLKKGMQMDDIVEVYEDDKKQTQWFPLGVRGCMGCYVVVKSNGKKYHCKIYYPLPSENYYMRLKYLLIYLDHCIHGHKRCQIDISSEFEQLNYLMIHDQLMKGVEPCTVARNVKDMHDLYMKIINKSEIQSYADIYFENPRVKEKEYHKLEECFQLFKDGLIVLFDELGYHENHDWIHQCSLDQLEQIMNFHWTQTIPTYQQIKKTLMKRPKKLKPFDEYTAELFHRMMLTFVYYEEDDLYIYVSRILC